MASKKNIDIALQKIGEKLVQGFISEIRNSNKVATGALTNPSNWSVEVIDKRLVIRTLDYAGAVDAGRGPSREGDWEELYSALMQWVFDKNITLSQSGRTKGRRTGQFFKKGTVGLPSAKTKSVVYAMARKISRGGYGQKYGVADFTNKTMTRYTDYISSTIGEEYVEYIRQSLDETITNYLRNQ